MPLSIELATLLDDGDFTGRHAGPANTSSSESEHQVQSRLFLDIVVLEGATILELLACKDEALLVWRDALLVLDLGLDGVDGVSALDLKGDGLSSKSFDLGRLPQH